MRGCVDRAGRQTRVPGPFVKRRDVCQTRDVPVLPARIMSVATTSIASRDTRSRSLPDESTCASSVMAGTCFNSRKASNRRCSIEAADHGNWVVQPSWLSISLMNWPIFAAAASACPC